jgi:hypothetical protein
MAKNHHNPFLNSARSFDGAVRMRFARMVFAGSVCALVMTLPALAKNSQAQKTDDKSTSASCHAYQQAEDGSWVQRPCEEAGGSQTQHKPAAKGSEEEPR